MSTNLNNNILLAWRAGFDQELGGTSVAANDNDILVWMAEIGRTHFNLRRELDFRPQI